MQVTYIVNGRSMTREEFEHHRYRPDLPHCDICDDGKHCACTVGFNLMTQEERDEAFADGPIACGCMGFTGCQACGRGRD